MQIQLNTIAKWCVFAGVFISGVDAGFAQGNPEEQVGKQPAIKVQTSLVMVPAIVTDRSGKPIADLKEEDFEVRRDGKIQKIGYFKHVQTNAEVMKPAAAPSDGFTNAVESGNQRLTIFMLDFLNSSFTEQRAAREELLKFLSKSLDVKEPVSLLALDQTGVKVIHDFTMNPAVLAEALKNVTERATSKDKPQSNAVEDTYRMVAGWNSRSASRSAAMAQSRLDTLRNAENHQSLDRNARVAATLEALCAIGEAFSGIPGRKSMVWATGGIPFEIGDAAMFGLRDSGLLPAYEQAWRALNRANIAVYPLDVEQLVNPAFVGAEIGRPLPQHARTNLTVTNMERFAEVTGGKFCDQREDAESCFREAANDSSDYYLLGIYENSVDLKPGWRKLSVKVSRPDVRVRSRAGYYVGSVQDEKRQIKDEMEIALSSPFDYTAIPLAVRWSLTKEVRAKGERRVDFMFTLAPGAATLDESASNHLSLEFAALAKDAKGTPRGSFSQNVEGHVTQPVAADIQKNGVNFPGNMDLPPGEFILVFVVRDNLSRQIGTVSAVIKVP
ncbi:MAG: VWA domain-containing protein [Candidatus Acidiferrales bacterium]